MAKLSRVRLGYLFANVIIATAFPIMVLALISEVAGVAVYSDIATGYALGSFAATVLAFGYDVTGPTAVAQLRPEESASYSTESLRVRLLLLPIILAAVFFSCWALSERPLLAVLSGVTASLTGLGMDWFFVGRSRTRTLILFDTAPKIGAGAIGLLFVVAYKSVELFLLSQLAGAILALALSFGSIYLRVLRTLTRVPPARHIAAIIKAQVVPLGTGLSISIYLTLPLPILVAVNRAAAVEFSASQRLAATVLALSAPVIQALQAWVPADKHWRVMSRRMVRALQLTAIVAVAFGLVTTCTLVIGVRLLTDRQADTSIQTALVASIAVMTSVASQVTGLVCLATMGASRTVLQSTTLGAIVGVTLLPLLGGLLGNLGAWTALAVAELIVLIYQSVELRRFYVSNGLKQVIEDRAA